MAETLTLVRWLDGKNDDMTFPTHLFLLPVLVDGPGEYVTRGGETVVVERVVGPGVLTAMARGRYSCGTPEAWYACGRVLAHSLSCNDIVGKAPSKDA